MKRLLFSLLLILIVISSFCQDVLPVPVPARWVVDKANILSKSEINNLESKLVAFIDSTTIQLAVVTVPTLGGVKLEDYALKLFNTWGIGQKDKNNGLLILVVSKERKVRIEVGRGLESYVTNSEAAAIIKEDIVPFFKRKDYYTGLVKAVNKLCIKSLPSVKDEAEKAEHKKVDTGPGFSPDFSQPEVSTATKWGVGGAIFAGFLALLAGISWFARLLLPNGWNYGRHHHLNDTHSYYSDSSSSGSESSSSSDSGSSDFGGGDSGGSGSSDSW